MQILKESYYTTCICICLSLPSHFSRSRAPGQRNNVRDGAVLANKKRVIQFVMIFYSFRVITDLMLMFVMFVTILFLNLFVPILDNRIQVYNYFFSNCLCSNVRG